MKIVHHMIGIAVLLLGTSSWISEAEAQVTGVQSDGFRQSSVVDRSLLHRGRMELLLNTAGSVSFNDSASDSTSNKQLTAFANPSIVFGYMLTDGLELRGDLGYRFERTSLQGERLQNSHALSLSVQVLYHAELRHGLALYGGLGLGGYWGRTAHPSSQPGTLLTHTTTGGLAQVLTGILIQPGPNFLLRTGIRVEGTYGVELGSTTGAEDITSTNIHVAGEIGIGLRFGGS